MPEIDSHRSGHYTKTNYEYRIFIESRYIFCLLPNHEA